MGGSEDLSVEMSTFTARVEDGGGPLRVVLAGQADIGALAHLDELLQHVHRRALELRAGEVFVDMTALEFMNSSCLAKMITWLNRVRDCEVATQYRIRLVASTDRLWQRRSLHALRCFAVDLVTIES
jgi:hypothetical protein